MFFFYRALVWAGRVGISCTIDPERMQHNKYVIFVQQTFLTTAERVHLNHLNRLVVPFGSDSAAQSLTTSVSR
jgi:hypothetical protein